MTSREARKVEFRTLENCQESRESERRERVCDEYNSVYVTGRSSEQNYDFIPPLFLARLFYYSYIILAGRWLVLAGCRVRRSRLAQRRPTENCEIRITYARNKSFFPFRFFETSERQRRTVECGWERRAARILDRKEFQNRRARAEGKIPCN